MSEVAVSPGSSAAPPLSVPAEDKMEIDAATAQDVSMPVAGEAIQPEVVAPTITPAKKSKPKKKSAAQARASEALKDEVSSQAGDGARSSPAPSAVEGESVSGQAGTGLSILDGTNEAAKALGGADGEVAAAGPSVQPASVKKPTKAAPKRSAPKKNTEGHHLLQYTNTFVPPLVNIKNPPGDYAQRESNIDVIRQNSQAKARLEKETVAAERAATAATDGGEPVALVNPLDNIIIIHPGSRTLRIARASQYAPYVVPNCIARRTKTLNWGTAPPVPGSRVKRLAAKAEQERHNKKRRKENGETHELKEGDVDMDGARGGADYVRTEGGTHTDSRIDEDEMVGEDWQNPVDTSITALREYLKEHLRLRRLSTNFDEVRRIRAANSRIKPENIPDLNDPHRIEWTEVEGQKYFIGVDALRLPPSKDFSVRYPILNRQLNTRDWQSSQLLMDDIGLIISHAMRKELGIDPKDLSKFSVVLVVPDHGDRFYVQEMTNLLLGSMGFKEIAIHQVNPSESNTAIFCAAMSSSCVVDIGANRTSITCVDEGLVVQDSRVVLNYGGDDVTIALTHLLERAAFPYKELDLARAQDWLMMDALKMRICTLEEHLVANTAWEVFAVREVQPTQKYPFRTFDENVLAPLTWFDTSMIDFAEKKGRGRFRIRGRNKGVSDGLHSGYDEITAAMSACTRHLWQPKRRTTASDGEIKGRDGSAIEASILPEAADDVSAQFGDPAPQASSKNGFDGTGEDGIVPPRIVEIPSTEPGTAAPSANGTPAPDVPNIATSGADADTTPTLGTEGEAAAGTIPTVPQPAVAGIEYEMPPGFDVFKQSSQSALDGAIAASISQAGSENRIKAAAGNILLIGGASALKGLPGILQDRLPHLIREATGVSIDHVSLVPPPRGLDPAFVSWKGASVMCNLEALSDMWIRRDEWEALGARALKDRCLFL